MKSLTDPEDVRGEAVRQWKTFEMDERSHRAAAIFRAIADDDFLIRLCSTAPPENLPTWTLFAAIQLLGLRYDHEPIARYLRDGDETMALADPEFAPVLVDFARRRESELLELLADRTCQMNVAHRAGTALVPTLCAMDRAAPGGEYAIIEVGSSAGLQLLFDRFHYAYSNGATIGPESADIRIEVTVVGGDFPVSSAPMPAVYERIGLDVSPVDLEEPDTMDWVRASAGFDLDLFDRILAAGLAGEIDVRRADAVEDLSDLVEEIPRNRRLIIYDSVAVCYMDGQKRRDFNEKLVELSRRRPLTWISMDPLLPTSAPRESVQDIRLATDLVGRFQDRFQMLVAVVSYRDGFKQSAPLAVSHPWGLSVDWLADDAAFDRLDAW
ncbi:MAG: DUF2332 family protein [Myxococcota bacterium]